MAFAFQVFADSIRADLVAVGKSVSIADTLLGVDEIVYICTALCPSDSGLAFPSIV
jgi:hypothetical protein